MTTRDLIDVLAVVVQQRGALQHVRSDNGPEFIAGVIKQWMDTSTITTAYIDPRAPWQNGYIESFNGKLRDELLSMKTFDSLAEAIVLVEEYRREYNNRRPHSALKNLPPAEFARHIAADQLTLSRITSGT